MKGEKEPIKLPTGNAHVYYGNMATISIDGFTATANELEILMLQTEGLSRREIGLRTHRTESTIQTQIEHLRRRNPTPDHLHPVTKTQLVLDAYRHELLYPISIIGLKARAGHDNPLGQDAPSGGIEEEQR